MNYWIYSGVAVFAVVLFFPLVRSWWRKPKPTRPASNTVKVEVTESYFTVEDTWRKTVAKVAWADVSRLTLITTDQGPWTEDLFYHVIYTDGELTLPSKAQGMDGFNNHVMSLPGYSPEAHTAASCSTENNSFAVVFQA